jgi:hypothetical protein
MQISWGTKIAFLYIGFVVLIVSLVAATMFTKTDLVADDYYHQETIFQQKLNAANASAAINDPVTIREETDSLVLQFPAVAQEGLLTGSIHCYAPSNAAADRTIPLETREPIFRIPKKDLQKIPYEIQVSWTAGGQSYYQSLAVNLQ